MHRGLLVNHSLGQILSFNSIYANHFFSRLQGLLSPSSSNGHSPDACWLKPCQWIHTFGMKYPIDLFFLDRKNRILKIIRNVKPNQFSPWVRGAYSVIETQTGLDHQVCQTGHEIEFQALKEISIKKKGKPLGQASVEAAFALVFILILLFPLTDVMRIAYNWMGLQYAVNEAARFGSIGAGDSKNREQEIRNQVISHANGFNIPVDSITFQSESGAANPGGPLEFFTLTATRNLTITAISGTLFRFVTGDYSDTFPVSARMTIRNEPFPGEG